MASIFYQAYSKSKLQESFFLFPGKPKRDFVYIKDVVEANLHSLNIFDGISGSVFDVGTCEARMFEEGLDLLEIRYKYHEQSRIPKGYQMHTCADEDKLLPGWKPNHDLRSGIREYKEYLARMLP
jgi:nucleoside-diphosphate-sugar epimerase